MIIVSAKSNGSRVRCSSSMKGKARCCSLSFGSYSSIGGTVGSVRGRLTNVFVSTLVNGLSATPLSITIDLRRRPWSIVMTLGTIKKLVN